ncbi:MAG: cyclic nucleotide-binding domain-containing protein [Spirochaetes bacterium]|nr:cyclic nucleotide-binding domain-containing protein [Spirochaetota bacterium]
MVDSAALQKYSLFGGMLPEEIERIKPLLEYASFDEGETIMREGESNDRIQFILEGRVEVSRLGIRLVEFAEGDAFGEMELLDVMPSAATVKALVHTRVATISNHAIHEIYHLEIRTFALMIMNLARDLSRRLRHMDEVMLSGSGWQKSTAEAKQPAADDAKKTPPRNRGGA